MTKAQISETLAGAACLCALTKKQNIAVQTYLLTVIADVPADVSMLVSAGPCYACIPEPIQDSVLAYLLAQLNGSTGTPAQIIAAAPCVECVPPRSYEGFKTYLLAIIAGVPVNAASLVSASSCFLCLPENLLKSLQVYLLTIVNGDVSPPVPPGPGPSPEAQLLASQWGDEVETGGGARPSNNTLTAVGFLYDDLIAAGLLDHFYTLNVFVPDNLTAAITPIRKTHGFDSYVNTGFVDADLNGYGLKGDGVAKCLDTGVNLTDIVSKADMSLICMADDCPITVGGQEIGVQNGAGADSYQVSLSSSAVINPAYYGCLGDLPFDTGTGRTQLANTMPGYLCVTRTAVNLQKLYIANKWNPYAEVHSIATTPTLWNGNVTFHCFCRHSTLGTSNSFSFRRLKVAGIAKGLTPAQSLALYNALNSFRESIENGTTTYGQDWAIRVTKNGGAAPSAATIAALDTFMDTLTISGLLAKIDCINAVAPDNLIAATTPIWRKWGTDPWTNSGFLAGDLTVSGVVGAAAKAFTNTGIVQGNGLRLGQNTGWTYYFSVASVGGVIGALDTEYQIVVPAANQLLWDTPFNGGGGRLTIGAGMGAGYFHCMRSSNSNAQVYSANSGLAHGLRGTNATGGIPALSAANTTIMQVMGRAPFPAGGQMSGTLSFWSYGQALSLAESSTYFNAVQALRTALGGGYV